MMQDGNSFLLLGIRRTGKSSFLKEVRRHLENNPENTCMALDCNHYRNVLQFYQGIYLQLDSVGISRKLLAGLNSVRLEPFSRDDGRQLFEQLAASKNADWWNPSVTEKLLDILPDYLPYFLQFSFHHLCVDHCRDPEKVEEIYHNYIYPGLLRDFVYQFEERLKVFSGENFEPTALLLDFVAARNTTTLDYLQDYTNHNFRYDLLVQLLDYEFLTLDGEQRYRFSLDIIRQWWRQKRNIEIV